MSGLTPLLELIPKTFDQSDRATIKLDSHILEDIASAVLNHWGFEQPFFLDLWHLPPTFRCENGSHPFVTFNDYAQDRDLRLIPVTGLDSTRTAAYQSAVAHVVKENSQGACIRLLSRDLHSTTLKEDLCELLQYLNLTPSETDLIIDYQYIIG